MLPGRVPTKVDGEAEEGDSPSLINRDSATTVQIKHRKKRPLFRNTHRDCDFERLTTVPLTDIPDALLFFVRNFDLVIQDPTGDIAVVCRRLTDTVINTARDGMPRLL